MGGEGLLYEAAKNPFLSNGNSVNTSQEICCPRRRVSGPEAPSLARLVIAIIDLPEIVVVENGPSILSIHTGSGARTFLLYSRLYSSDRCAGMRMPTCFLLGRLARSRATHYGMQPACS